MAQPLKDGLSAQESATRCSHRPLTLISVLALACVCLGTGCTLQCGSCTSPQTCVAGEANVCGTSTGGAIVNAAPTGPAVPNGGWHLVYADAFGLPLSDARNGNAPAGHDNHWALNRFTSEVPGGQPGDTDAYGTSEITVFNASQVSVGSEGLILTETYWPNRAPAVRGYGVRNYIGGQVDTYYSNGFKWRPGGGETWAFEIVCKFAPGNDGNDEGWWSTDAPWTDEFDFFEHWAYHADGHTGIVWAYDTNPFKMDYDSLKWPFDPSAAFHRYTTVIYPDNSFSEFVDGQLLTQLGNNGRIDPPPYFDKVWMALIISYSLRGPNPVPTFTYGTREFVIRSVAAYQDGANAGQDVMNPGMAPGTTVR